MTADIDVKNSSLETQHFLKDVQQAVHELVPGADIILYGSRARGDAGARSDWDFLILVGHPRDRHIVVCLRNQFYELELEPEHDLQHYQTPDGYGILLGMCRITIRITR